MNSTPAIKLDFANGGSEPQSITIQPAKVAGGPSQKEMGYMPPLSQPLPHHQPPPPQPQQFQPAPAPAPRAQPAPPSKRPHPLLWITLGISVVALVLNVPKGSLPTLTGRHKVLREQEVLVQEQLSLLSHFSAFLPPPIASLLAPELNDARSTLDALRLGTGLQLWNVNGNAEGFWTLEDLGHGASVVRSGSGSTGREVWILRDGEGDATPAVAALAASLNARERLQRELEACRSAPSPQVMIDDGAAATAVNKEHELKEREMDEREKVLLAREREAELEKMRKDDRVAWEREMELREAQKDAAREQAEREQALKDRRKQLDREDRERETELRRRMRERVDEMEEREREVVRREKWVVDAMRKLSDKTREGANELTMEDRITERLKAYKRQLAELHDEQ